MLKDLKSKVSKVTNSVAVVSLIGLAALANGCATPAMRLKYNLVSDNRNKTYDYDTVDRKVLLYNQLVAAQRSANGPMDEWVHYKPVAEADGRIDSQEATNLKRMLKSCIITSQDYRELALKVRAEVALDQRELMYLEVIKPIERNIDVFNREYLKLNGK